MPPRYRTRDGEKQRPGSGGTTSTRARLGKQPSRAVAARREAFDFYGSSQPPVFTAASMARCWTLLLGAHHRCGCDSILSKLPPELLEHICRQVREPIDECSAFHFVASSNGTSSLHLWLIVHEHRLRSPTATRVILQHVELPPDGTPRGSVAALPVVVRMLGHYEGFSGRNLLIRWTHRVECPGLQLCDWPVACTAEELHAPRIVLPSRRTSAFRREADSDADANPLVLMLPRLSHSAPPTALDLERLSFKRVLLARHPDVHHTSVTICGKPIGQTLQEAPDSVGDAEECFAKITRGGNREEELRAEDEDARIVQVMAVIAQQCERIRMEAEEEAQSALHASQADLEA